MRMAFVSKQVRLHLLPSRAVLMLLVMLMSLWPLLLPSWSSGDGDSYKLGFALATTESTTSTRTGTRTKAESVKRARAFLKQRPEDAQELLSLLSSLSSSSLSSSPSLSSLASLLKTHDDDNDDEVEREAESGNEGGNEEEGGEPRRERELFSLWDFFSLLMELLFGNARQSCPIVFASDPSQFEVYLTLQVQGLSTFAIANETSRFEDALKNSYNDVVLDVCDPEERTIESVAVQNLNTLTPLDDNPNLTPDGVFVTVLVKGSCGSECIDSRNWLFVDQNIPESSSGRILMALLSQRQGQGQHQDGHDYDQDDQQRQRQLRELVRRLEPCKCSDDPADSPRRGPNRAEFLGKFEGTLGDVYSGDAGVGAIMPKDVFLAEPLQCGNPVEMGIERAIRATHRFDELRPSNQLSVDEIAFLERTILNSYNHRTMMSCDALFRRAVKVSLDQSSAIVVDADRREVSYMYSIEMECRQDCNPTTPLFSPDLGETRRERVLGAVTMMKEGNDGGEDERWFSTSPTIDLDNPSAFSWDPELILSNSLQEAAATATTPQDKSNGAPSRHLETSSNDVCYCPGTAVNGLEGRQAPVSVLQGAPTALEMEVLLSDQAQDGAFGGLSDISDIEELPTGDGLTTPIDCSGEGEASLFSRTVVVNAGNSITFTLLSEDQKSALEAAFLVSYNFFASFLCDPGYIRLTSATLLEFPDPTTRVRRGRGRHRGLRDGQQGQQEDRRFLQRYSRRATYVFLVTGYCGNVCYGDFGLYDDVSGRRRRRRELRQHAARDDDPFSSFEREMLRKKRQTPRLSPLDMEFVERGLFGDPFTTMIVEQLWAFLAVTVGWFGALGLGEDWHCFCSAGAESRAPNSSEQTDILNQLIYFLQESDFLPLFNSVLDIAEVEVIDCPPNLNDVTFTSSVSVEFDEDLSTLTDAEITELADAFARSYNDLIFRNCDEKYRFVVSAKFDEATGRTRRQTRRGLGGTTTATAAEDRSSVGGRGGDADDPERRNLQGGTILMNIVAECGGPCDANTNLYDFVAERRRGLEEVEDDDHRAKKSDADELFPPHPDHGSRGLQIATSSSCFCAVNSAPRAPTVVEHLAEYNDRLGGFSFSAIELTEE